MEDIMSKTVIEVGDRIKFKSPTRAGTRTAVRVVKEIDPHTGRPMVMYQGWCRFIVKINEIEKVIKQGE